MSPQRSRGRIAALLLANLRTSPHSEVHDRTRGGAMPSLVFTATTTDNAQSTTTVVVLSLITVVLMSVLLFLDLKYIRDSRRVAKTMDLPKGQWLRLVKDLPFDPAIELVAIGVVLADDILRNWEHAVVGATGAVVGLLVGRYRCRIQYVRAVPEHKAIVFVRSRAEYVALTILLLVNFASTQHQIPVVGPRTLLITLGLAVVVFESIGRSWSAYRRYKRETA